MVASTHASAHGPAGHAVLDNQQEETRYRLHRRFDRLGRLFGDEAVTHLMGLRVVVFGLGGVGSFAAESLSRSAIGTLMLVDFDDVCITNSNRQLQALKGHVGKPKAWVLRDRLKLINPAATVEAKRAFYNDKRADELLTAADGKPYDYVVDCIDNLTAKAHLLATCRERNIPIMASMGAAGKIDPTRIRIADLADTVVCPLARELRQILRQKYDFPATGPMGITSIYSDEKRLWPRELTYDQGEGFSCVCPKGDEEVAQIRQDLHGCDERTLIDGTVSYVTGAFGLACASAVINHAVQPLLLRAQPAVAKQGTAPKEPNP
jgi:tRNA threonylcarbamoyladenosine dehydratase